MELWIRSQDKMNLVKINQICVSYQNNNQIIANYVPDFIGTQGEYYENLGIYKTKERALEVLDEIQNFIKPTVEVKNNNIECVQNMNNVPIIQPPNFDVIIREVNTKIYQMPEE